MFSWIIIVVLVVLGVFLLKINHFRHKMWILIVILLALFLYSTIYIVNSQNNMDFTSFSGFMGSMKVYGGWLANGFQNLKSLGGEATEMDWTSVNGSFIENNSNPQISTQIKAKLNNRV